MWRNQQGDMRGSPTRLSYVLVIVWTMASSPMMFPTISASKEGASIMGDSACSLSPNAIATFGKNLLKQFSRCPSFTPDQVQAIRAVLSSGDTSFGPPSQWSSSTLEDLRGLFHLFDHSLLDQIPRGVSLPWMKEFLHTSHLPGEPSSRRKRATECPPDKMVTEEKVRNAAMPLDYSPAEVGACLKGPALEKYLGNVSDYAFTYEQQQAIKENLDEMYPGGYPESIIRNLGGLVDLINLDDIKKWKFTSADTLDSLLGKLSDEKLEPDIIKQYINSGGALNGQALNAIGSKYICLLKKDQLNQINEAAFKEVKPLDLSKCSQTTKDILYSKAKKAFSDQENNFPDYYNLTEPYLGGAPVEDLRALSSHNVNMDIQTFMGLRNDSVMGLTVDEVKGLLGKNLPELKNEQDNFPIKDWIRKQKQPDLHKLGIGLRGGIPVGYINITPRHSGPTETSAAHPATNSHALPVLAAILLTLLLTSLLT